MSEEWSQRFIATVERIDPELAAKLRAAGKLTTPVNGRHNESAEDHAVVYAAYMHHQAADAKFRMWVAHGEKSKVPRGDLNEIYRLATPPGVGALRTGFGDKQVSNLTRLWVKQYRATMRGQIIVTDD